MTEYIVTIEILCEFGMGGQIIQAFKEHFGNEASASALLKEVRRQKRSDWECLLLVQDVALTKAFLAAGADVHSCNYKDRMALWAIQMQKGRTDVFNLLIAAGADKRVYDEALWMAEYYGQIVMVHTHIPLNAAVQ